MTFIQPNDIDQRIGVGSMEDDTAIGTVPHSEKICRDVNGSNHLSIG